jgi:hypothetical protein
MESHNCQRKQNPEEPEQVNARPNQVENKKNIQIMEKK